MSLRSLEFAAAEGLFREPGTSFHQTQICWGLDPEHVNFQSWEKSFLSRLSHPVYDSFVVVGLYRSHCFHSTVLSPWRGHWSEK